MWPLRKRIPAQRVTGAQVRILYGLFGGPPPSPYAFVDTNSHTGGLYNYHEGEIFYPGAASFVFEPGFELPLKSIWGGGSGVNQGFMITGNGNSKFNPYQPPPLFSPRTFLPAGIGGLQAGQMAFQPLLESVPLPLPVGGA